MSGIISVIKEVFGESDDFMIMAYENGIISEDEFINTVGAKTASKKKEV